MNKTSDFIDFDKAVNKGFKLLKDDKKCRIGFFIIFSVNTGLRVSDILTIKHVDLSREKLIISEKKTKKERIITLNQTVIKAYEILLEKLKSQNVKINDDEYIFTSQKGSVYKTQSLNDLLKSIFNNSTLQISTHSLRKSFARRVYTNNNESENSLVLLSDIFSHSNISITRRYLGIRQETIDNVYLNL